MLDFDRVQNALEGLGSGSDAAEAHGTLCALLLDNAALATWLAQTLDELPGPGDVLATERLAVLERLFEQTRESMNNEDLSFSPLLPDETDDFGVRLLGLSGWCQGFLFGFGIVSGTKDDALDDVARECLSDLLEISKLSHDEAGGDEAELQFAEIVEHLRMVTLLLNDTLNPLKGPGTAH